MRFGIVVAVLSVVLSQANCAPPSPNTLGSQLREDEFTPYQNEEAADYIYKNPKEFGASEATVKDSFWRHITITLNDADLDNHNNREEKQVQAIFKGLYESALTAIKPYLEGGDDTNVLLDELQVAILTKRGYARETARYLRNNVYSDEEIEVMAAFLKEHPEIRKSKVVKDKKEKERILQKLEVLAKKIPKKKRFPRNGFLIKDYFEKVDGGLPSKENKIAEGQFNRATLNTLEQVILEQDHKKEQLEVYRMTMEALARDEAAGLHDYVAYYPDTKYSFEQMQRIACCMEGRKNCETLSGTINCDTTLLITTRWMEEDVYKPLIKHLQGVIKDVFGFHPSEKTLQDDVERWKINSLTESLRILEGGVKKVHLNAAELGIMKTRSPSKNAASKYEEVHKALKQKRLAEKTQQTTAKRSLDENDIVEDAVVNNRPTSPLKRRRSGYLQPPGSSAFQSQAGPSSADSRKTPSPGFLTPHRQTGYSEDMQFGSSQASPGFLSLYGSPSPGYSAGLGSASPGYDSIYGSESGSQAALLEEFSLYPANSAFGSIQSSPGSGLERPQTSRAFEDLFKNTLLDNFEFQPLDPGSGHAASSGLQGFSSIDLLGIGAGATFEGQVPSPLNQVPSPLNQGSGGTNTGYLETGETGFTDLSQYGLEFLSEANTDFSQQTDNILSQFDPEFDTSQFTLEEVKNLFVYPPAPSVDLASTGYADLGPIASTPFPEDNVEINYLVGGGAMDGINLDAFAETQTVLNDPLPIPAIRIEPVDEEQETGNAIFPEHGQ